MVETVRSLIRPVVTLIMTLAFIGFTYLDIVPKDAFVGTAVMVITFWFQSRSQNPGSPNGRGGQQ